MNMQTQPTLTSEAMLEEIKRKWHLLPESKKNELFDLFAADLLYVNQTLELQFLLPKLSEFDRKVILWWARYLRAVDLVSKIMGDIPGKILLFISRIRKSKHSPD